MLSELSGSGIISSRASTPPSSKGSASARIAEFLKMVDAFNNAPSRPYEFAFLLEPARYLYYLLLGFFHIRKLHRAFRVHVFPEHLGRALRHVLEELIFYLLFRALQGDAKNFSAQFLDDKLHAPVVRAHEVGEYEHLLLYAHRGVRACLLDNIHYLALGLGVYLVHNLGGKLYSFYRRSLACFSREHLLAYEHLKVFHCGLGYPLQIGYPQHYLAPHPLFRHVQEDLSRPVRLEVRQDDGDYLRVLAFYDMGYNCRVHPFERLYAAAAHVTRKLVEYELGLFRPQSPYHDILSELKPFHENIALVDRVDELAHDLAAHLKRDRLLPHHHASEKLHLCRGHELQDITGEVLSDVHKENGRFFRARKL